MFGSSQIHQHIGHRFRVRIRIVWKSINILVDFHADSRCDFDIIRFIQSEPAFRATLEWCACVLTTHTVWLGTESATGDTQWKPYQPRAHKTQLTCVRSTVAYTNSAHTVKRKCRTIFPRLSANRGAAYTELFFRLVIAVTHTNKSAADRKKCVEAKRQERARGNGQTCNS